MPRLAWPLPCEQVASGKIFVHDCTVVTALDLFLFGAEPQILHAQHKVLIDGWIDLRMSPRTAVLFKALRKQLLELMAARIAASSHPAKGGRDDEVPQSEWAAASSIGSSGHVAVSPGSPGWPPPLDTLERAQTALLSALVWLIGKGLELQEDENAAATAAAAIAKRTSQRR